VLLPRSRHVTVNAAACKVRGKDHVYLLMEDCEKAGTAPKTLSIGLLVSMLEAILGTKAHITPIEAPIPIALFPLLLLVPPYPSRPSLQSLPEIVDRNPAL
jgi:hypothetical protein